jgi:hypothetical protein
MHRKFHQVPHRRISRRGKPFTAGRGLPKLRRNYGSQILRDRIRRDLNATGPYRERIVRTMEKDPLLYKDYKETKYPPIDVDPHFYDKTGRLGQKVTKVKYTDLLFFKIPREEHSVKLDKKIFEQGLSSYKNKMGTRMEASPRKVLQHEIAHIKYDDMFKRHPDFLFDNVDEELADYRADYDIRKTHLPKSDEDNRTNILFKRLSKWEE